MFSDTKCVVDLGECAVDFGVVCSVKIGNEEEIGSIKKSEGYGLAAEQGFDRLADVPQS